MVDKRGAYLIKGKTWEKKKNRKETKKLRCGIIWCACEEVSSHTRLRIICVCVGGRTGDELEMMGSGKISGDLSDLIETFGLCSLFKSQPQKSYCNVKCYTILTLYYSLEK